MRNERARPQPCWKSFANESNIVALRFGDHGTKEMLGVVGWIVWLVSNFAQQHATTSNNMQRGVQTDATCNIQQCCVRLHAALYLNKLSRLYAEFRLTAENRNHAGNLLSLRTWKFQRLLELISVSFYLCNLCLCEFLYRFCCMKMI